MNCVKARDRAVGEWFFIAVLLMVYAFSVHAQNPEPAGWFTGDMHVHSNCGGTPLSPTSIRNLMSTHDVAVVCLLADMGNGEVLYPAVDLPKVNGQNDPVSTSTRIVHWDAEWHWDAIFSQFPHQALGGHVVALGLTNAYQIWEEYTYPIFNWAHQQGAIAGFAHMQGLDDNFPQTLSCCTPIEYPVEVALGACDFISQDFDGSDGTTHAYYRLLNCGFRPGFAAGSDYPCYASAIGATLTYVQVSGALTYRKWIDGIAAGRTVVSCNGHNEFLDLKVNSTATPGDEIQLSSSGNVQVTVQWTSKQNLSGTIELVQNGVVVASKTASVSSTSPQTLTATVNFTKSGWLCARRMGSGRHQVHTSAVYVTVGGAPVRASVSDAQFYVDWMDNLIQRTSPGGVWASYFINSRAAAHARYQAARNLYAQIALEAAGPLPVAITTPSLPNATIGVAYSATLAASGGTLPYSYTWSLPSGTLPPGLVLNAANGAITGTPTATGSFNFTVRATDANNTAQFATKPLSIVVGTAPIAATIWPGTVVPSVLTDSDNSAVELGLKFKSALAGQVTAIRFYKSTSNTGTHVGNLWTASGTKLATVTFANETASGWQQQALASPITINSNTTYVVSYHTTVGRYSSDPGYFVGSGVDSFPLRALADGESGANGVATYGSSAFPTTGFGGDNYWVDLVFLPTTTSPPTGTLTNITVTPATPTFSIGATVQFAASGSYDNGSAQDVTSQSTWISSNAAVATINGNGLASGVSAGVTTISATVAGITGRTILTVTNAPQGVGEYRSSTSGNWNQLATWQRFDGANWVAATATPTAANAAAITIRSPHTVTVTANVSADQVVIEAGGQVTVNNVTWTIANGPATDLVVSGKLRLQGNSGVITTTGTVSFESGGTYEHARLTGTIPTASWNTNSTCALVLTSPGSGSLGISGTGQAFGHFSITTTGTGSTGWAIGSSISCAGNFTLSNGSSRPAILANSGTARTLTVGGNCAITAGTLNLSSSTGIGTILVAGNFSHVAGTITETGSGSGAIVFNGSTPQVYTGGGIMANTINLTVNSGATLLMGTALVGNGSTGTFTLTSGGTLGIGHAQGITLSGATGNVRVTGARTYAAANYIFNGLTAQVLGAGLPATLNNLTIANPAGVTINSANTVTGTCTVNASALLLGTGSINGLIVLNGTVAPGASVGTLSTGAETWNGGGSYTCEINNATGAPGSGHDRLNAGTHTITVSATSTNKFVLRLVSMNGSLPGAAANFNPNTSYSWAVASGGGISSFAADKFVIDASAFQNDTAGGTFGVALAGGNTTLTLTFTPAPSVTLNNLSQVYNGTARVVAATTTPFDLPVTITYNGSTNAPINAGTYQAVGTVSGTNYTASATNTLVVAPAAATVALSDLSQMYNGNARVATATTIPIGLPVSLQYNGSLDAPTNAGSYQVVGIVNNINYTGGVTNTLTVSQQALSAVADDASRVFGQTNPVFTGVLTGVQSGNDITAAYGSAAAIDSPAGEYPIVPVVIDHDGTLANYSVALTNGVLTVVGLPCLLGITETTEGTFVLTWKVEPQRFYRLQFKGSLADSEWTDLEEIQAQSASLQFERNAGASASGIYRLLDSTGP